MAVFLSPIGIGAQFFSFGGLPLNGGFLYTYAAGSTTPQATYTTNAGSIANANPITLAADGRPPQQIWLTGGQSYKFVLTDATGVQLATYDNLYGLAAASVVNVVVGDVSALSLNTGPLAGLRNRLINANFSINQRIVSGTVTLAAGAYGHDRWKAGAGGATYTFAASGADTVITITAGSLMQVVEGLNIEGGVYRLSHQGTAQARTAVNGAATTGAYAANPQSTASATGGQTVAVEFTTGTVDRVQLEGGTLNTVFERRPVSYELSACQRYYEMVSTDTLTSCSFSNAQFGTKSQFKVTKRVTPTLVITPVYTLNCSARVSYGITPDGFGLYFSMPTSGVTCEGADSTAATAEL